MWVLAPTRRVGGGGIACQSVGCGMNCTDRIISKRLASPSSGCVV